MNSYQRLKKENQLLKNTISYQKKEYQILQKAYDLACEPAVMNLPRNAEQKEILKEYLIERVRGGKDGKS